MKTYSSPLAAYVSGDLDAADALLSDEWSPDHCVDGEPMLIMAINFRRADMVRWLLNKGADPNIRSNGPGEVTALVKAVAIRAGEQIVNLLLESGADPNPNVPEHLLPEVLAVAADTPVVAKLIMRWKQKGNDRCDETGLN